MKKINLYLILAPFQLLSAVENVEREGGAEVYLIIRGTKSSRNIEQILKVLDEGDWDKVIYLDENSDVLVMLELLWLKISFIFKNIKVVSLNIGEFRSRLCQWAIRIINSEKVGLLDDGVASLAFYTPGGQTIRGMLKQEDLSKFSSLYFNLSKQKKLILKSFLSLPDSSYWTVDKYKFSKFRGKIKSSACEILEKEVFFLGGKFVEDKYCDIETYFKLCQLVIKKFPNKKITYIPHRGETEEKVLLLQKHFSFEILRPSKPVELYLAEIISLPNAIVSFQSAVLFTIPELFPEMSVYYARFNLKYLSEQLGVDGVIDKYLESMNNISILDIG